MQEAQKHAQYRVGERFTLVLGKKPAEPFVKAEDGFLAEIDPDEIDWMLESVNAMAEKCAGRARKQALENDQAFMRNFERELEKEKQQLEGREKEAHG